MKANLHFKRAVSSPLLALMVAGTLVACGSDPGPITSQAVAKTAKPANANAGKPRVVEAHLSSDEPAPGETLSVWYEAKDSKGNDIEASFLWQWNQRTLPEAGPSIQVPLGAQRGDTVKVRLVARDGRHASDPVWSAARVANSPEEWVDLRLEPAGEVPPGTSLTVVSEVEDHDGDPIEYEYHWKLNEQSHRNKGAHFSTIGLQRGETVMVEVTASDGETVGTDRSSNVVTIANSNPTIISSPPDFSADGTLEYEVRAKDQDGDRRFIYSLDASPGSMEVDRVTGLLKSVPTKEDIGPHKVEVRVEDRYGGFALQHFELIVSHESRAHTMKASPASPE